MGAHSVKRRKCSSSSRLVLLRLQGGNTKCWPFVVTKGRLLGRLRWKPGDVRGAPVVNLGYRRELQLFGGEADAWNERRMERSSKCQEKKYTEIEPPSERNNVNS